MLRGWTAIRSGRGQRRLASNTKVLLTPGAASGHPFAGQMATIPRDPERLGDAPLLSGPFYMNKRLLVCIVDDNESVRESLPDLVQHAGYLVQTFASAEEFLASPCVDEASCLVLDVGLPGMSGPELHKELIRRGRQLPVVFITAQGDRSLPSRLVAAGAVACLLKPFSDTALIEALQSACHGR
jgi:CheY-like chemotaxis protein